MLDASGFKGENILTDPEVVDGQLRYNVFVLGTRGAGKTVFLACLHQQLRNEFPENRFHLKIDDVERENELNDIYLDIIDPSKDWPPPSGQLITYEFKCLHTLKRGPQDLFRISYIDYPGGVLGGRHRTELSLEDIKTIRSQTEKAHSIIALIDGAKVLDAIKGRDKEGILRSDLDTLAARLAAGATKPVVFLLTKYDLLHGHHSLMRIRQELFKSLAFRGLVRLRSQFGLPAHLIPVSAVGFNFASFDPKTRRMRKLPNAAAQPHNIELALGCTVIDQFRLYEEDRRRRDPKTWLLRKTMDFTKWLGRIVASDPFWNIPGVPVKLNPLKVLYSVEIADVSLDEHIQNLVDRLAFDQQSAIDLVFELMAARLVELKVNEPAADLTALLEKN
jgi:hypothetical protein